MSNFYKFLVGGCIVLGFSACEKHDSLYKGDGREGTKLADLTIPANFDWKTSDAVECAFVPATHPSRVEIYDDNACSPENLLASVYVDEESEPVKVQLVRSQKTVYARYMDENGKFVVKPVSVENGQIAFQVPENSRNFSSVLPETKGDKEDKGNKLKSKGTILFEDSYPVKGDYDFNDYVIVYDFEAFTDKNGKLNQLKVELKFVAKGGLFPYEPYLQLKGIRTQHDIRIKKEDDTTEGLDVKSYKHEGNDQDIILQLTGVPEVMERLRQGGKYVNTEKGYINEDDDDFPEVEFTLYFNGNELNKYNGGDIYDIFLGGEMKGQFTEIHLKEFESTRLVKGDKVTRYCTEDNFVWAIKIDKACYKDEINGHYELEVFPYLYEQQDFLTGYPNFVKFLTDENAEWYTKGNRVDEQLIFFMDEKDD